MENTDKVEFNDRLYVKTAETQSGIEGDTISTEDIVDKASGDIKTKSNIQTEKFLEQNKDEVKKIDWNSIVYENEEKTIPLVSEEDMEIYQAVTYEFMGELNIDSWVNFSKGEIIAYETLLHKEDKTEEDEEELKVLKESAQSSKELLALIQTQSKELRKDFEENKIAENTIKAGILKTLHDFILKRYPVLDSEKKEKYDRLEVEMMENMYIITIFEQALDRDISKKYLNRVNPKLIDSDAFDYSAAISIYLKNIDAEDNIDLGAIIARDFEFMNFFVITVLYSVYKYGSKDFVTKNIKNISEDTLKALDDTMNPCNAIENTAKYKDINKTISDIITKFEEKPQLIKDIYTGIENAVKSDNIVKYYLSKNSDGDLDKVYTSIINNIPVIKDNKTGEWNRYYRAIRKLNVYFMFKQLYDLGNKDGFESEDFKSAVFNVIIKYMKYVYEHYYTSFICDFTEFINININAKDSRAVFFKTSINFLNTMYSFGFKSSYNTEEKENIAPGIYALAKKKLGKIYDTTIVDEEEDFVLKDVDLNNIKVKYSEIVYKVLKAFDNSLDATE